MQKENFISRSIRWVYSTQKFFLFTLLLLLAIVVVKNLAITLIDNFDWYKKNTLIFLKSLETMSIILCALAAISKIPYIRVPLVTAGMTFILLMGVENVCMVLYEYQHRPKSDDELAEEVKRAAESEKNNNLLSFFKSKKAKDPAIPDAPPQQIPAEVLGVDVLPENFEQLKIEGAPEFEKKDPAWHDWQQRDTLFGYMNKINSRVEINSWNYGIPNPVAHYSIDSLGRRITGNELNNQRRNYALFFGCSVTFGVLVDDKQTLPSILERIDTNYRSYNYGVSGYGTHHMLALLENRNLKKEVNEKEGVAFYIYFPGHVNRAIGDMDSYLAWNAESPFYYLDGEEVVRRKNFKEGRKLISRFYEWFSQKYICKYFDLHLPGKLRANHYKLAAKLIEKSAKEYEKQFGNNSFYVVFLPGWGNDIKPFLDELNIKYLDYDRLLLYWQDKYRFAGDGHPRPLLYKILAEQLENDVLKKQRTSEIIPTQKFQ